MNIEKNIEETTAQKINNSAVLILKNHPSLSRFNLKVKLESQNNYRITLHGKFKGVDVCVSKLGDKLWDVFKVVESRFINKIKKIRQSKISKIKKDRNLFIKNKQMEIDIELERDFIGQEEVG